MNRISGEHQQRNTDSRPRWDCFAAHRQQVTQRLIAASSSPLGRLCVLGAGNCNDLDLAALTASYGEIHLADLDQGAMEHGLAAQGQSLGVIQVHGGVDLAGCNAIADDWRPGRWPPEADVQHCLEVAAAHNPAPRLPGPFDTVASICLLTQLYDSIAITLGGDHPRFVELLTCIRLRHVRLLFELLRPGGTALLITDFVSSGTYPPLATTAAEDLPALAARLIKSRNFFTGANPGVLHQLFQTDPVVAPAVRNVEVSPPWLWDFGPRTYAVCAISAEKRPVD